MITQKQVKHIAKLARLGLNKKEIEKFQKEFSKILDYVKKIEKLKEVNVEKSDLANHLTIIKNIMRDDEEKNIKSETRNKIIKQMPKTKNGYLKIQSLEINNPQNKHNLKK